MEDMMREMDLCRVVNEPTEADGGAVTQAARNEGSIPKQLIHADEL